MKHFSVGLILFLCSCLGGSEQGYKVPYNSDDLDGACAVLIAGRISARDRCGVNLPDESDNCHRWPVSDSCSIARCGWLLTVVSCERVADICSEICSFCVDGLR